jgi:F0F1-type ATP synthase assembly protein I
MREMPRPGDRKPRLDKLRTFERSMRAFQENVQRAGPAAGASYTLTGGILLLGGLGYAVDKWLHTSPWLFLTGLTLGIVVGFYALVMSTRQ